MRTSQPSPDQVLNFVVHILACSLRPPLDPATEVLHVDFLIQHTSLYTDFQPCARVSLCFFSRRTLTLGRTFLVDKLDL